MKKAIIVLFIIVLVLLTQVKPSNNIEIPKDSIRYRIIANSNSVEDQAMKMQINKEIEPVISDILNNSLSLEDTRLEIKKAIPTIKNTLDTYNIKYDINFGNNYFPEKEYYGVKYPAGEYESLVITLGQGQGDNWWCVLFPPLCLLEAKENEIAITSESKNEE